MKKSIKLFVLIFALTITSLSVQAKHKVGLIVILDTTITHTFIGLTIFDNFSNTYDMPFDLNDYSEEKAMEVFGGGYSTIELIKIDRKVFDEYKLGVDSLCCTDFRQFRKNWFNRVKSEYGVVALIALTNTSTSGLHQRINVKGTGLLNGIYSNFNSAYINMSAFLIWNKRPKIAICSTISKNYDELPNYYDRKIKIRKSDLLLLEKPLKELIEIQIKEISQDPDYSAMKLFLNDNY